MPRNLRPTDLDLTELEALLTTGNAAPPLPLKVEMLSAFRAISAQHAARADEFLLGHLCEGRVAIERLERTHRELETIIATLTTAPWHPALFLGVVETATRTAAMVLHHGAERVVAIAQDVDPSLLAIGQEVLLSHELNVIVDVSPRALPRCGETATVERLVGDDRCILRWRDEAILVDLAARLIDTGLAPGDQVRWNRSAWLAIEKIDQQAPQPYLLTQIPQIERSQIGGQDEAFDQLCGALTAALVDPERASRYRQTGRQTVLMVGPPGVGKTLMARAAVSEISRISQRDCQFAVVKPGEWSSPWVGVTEENIRRCFRALREAAARGPAVLFLDEIEAISRIRGGTVSHFADLALSAFLAEVDGFAPRDNVALVCACNRKDLIDAAVLERIAATEIRVRRPDMRAARSVFTIHLPDSLPFAGGSDTRAQLIDTAVSRLYSPNAEGVSLCRLHFRSGGTRLITARELMSGRLIEQLCATMARSAFWRDANGGEAGIGMSDLEAAVTDMLERLRTTLTPHNAHAHLDDLPHDNDVVRVEPIVPRIARPHRYRRAA